MIGLNEISMSYGSKLLFFEASLILNDNTRYALVGANGTGKSTLLKLITGEETPLSGTITTPKDSTLGWLKQDQFRFEDTDITDVVIQGKTALWDALVEKQQLIDANEWDDRIANRLGLLEETIAHQNGYSANALAEKLLTGLGIHPEYHHQPLKMLSGGYKLRVLLAQTLFQQPDILLLDEPTNHLDIVSIQWLEKYLRTEFQGTILFISHDMEFINRLADYILDVDYGEIRQYSGHYDKFLAEKQLIQDQKLQTKKNLEARVAQMQQFIDRFGAKASKAKQAQARAKMIEKIEVPDIKHTSRVAPHFKFKLVRPSGKVVVTVKNIVKSFKDKKVIDNVSFTVARGERIAIVGENGVGKSTLIKMLVGAIPADQGEYEWGHEAHISYFSQDHHELLNQSIDALSWLKLAAAQGTEQQIRQTLGQVLFTKDEVEKDVLSISGGEAARLLLAKMMLDPANILILDEPTNHLDLETAEALALALKEYPGTVIVVSHNRHFLDKFANRVLFIAAKSKIQDFKGKFADFLATMNV